MSLSRPLLPPLYAPSRRGQPMGAAPESGQGLDHDERSNGASEADSDSLSEVVSGSSDGGESSSIEDGSDGSDSYGSSEHESICDYSSEHPESDDGESVDDSHGDCSEEEEHNGRYHNEEGNGYGDVHRDLCDVAGFHLDEDIRLPPQRSKRHKMIIVALSAALLLLLINFGYGLFRLSRLNDAVPPPNASDDARITQSEPRAAAKGNADRKISSDDAPRKDSRHPQSTANDAATDKEYQLPRHPARIYTHASLSSKNYRAGGVLSDEMLRRYEDDGAIVVRNLVSPKLLDRLDAASAMLIEGQDEKGKKRRRGKQFHMVKNGAIFLGVPKRREGSCGADDANEDGTCQANPKSDGSDDDNDDDVILSSFRDLAMYSKIPRLAASLLRLDELRAGGEQNLQLSRQQKMMQQQQEAEGDGEDSVNLRICRDIFLTKDNDPYACGWHVDDTGFWPSIASDPGVNAWVALDDMPFPQSGIRLNTKANATTSSSSEGESTDERVGPVATFALSLGSHRAPWRHQAYEVTGSTHTMPEEGFLSAIDLIQRRSGSGTCNIETSAPDLYEKLERNKVIYDLKRGDVIFHDRWLFHRTVTTGEYDKMVNGSEGEQHRTSQGDKIFRRYSVRYSPGSAVVPPGYGVELSVLHDEGNANRTLDEIVERSGPWYPKVWPHVLKSKPVREPGKSEGIELGEEEIEGISELVHEMMPRAEELQRERKKEIQRLLSIHGGQ